MSSYIVPILAKGNISGSQLLQLIKTAPIATGEHTYDAERLFETIIKEYGWKPVADGDDSICLRGWDYAEAVEVSLPDGTKPMIYVHWDETKDTPDSVLLLQQESHAENGFLLNGLYTEGGTLMVCYARETDLDRIYASESLPSRDETVMATADPDIRVLGTVEEDERKYIKELYASLASHGFQTDDIIFIKTTHNTIKK